MIEPVGQKRPVSRTVDTNPNMTSFFRSPFQYHALCWVLERTFNLTPATERIRIWVPGCSDGREPYSIAMIIRDKQYHRRGEGLEILATDINFELLMLAKQGIYRELDARVEAGIDTEAVGNKDILAKYRDSYFDVVSGKLGERLFKVKPPLKRMVRFRQDDLRFSKVTEQFDVVSCHHLLEHLTGGERTLAAGNLIARLRPGGFLVTNDPIFSTRKELVPLPTQRKGNRIGYTAYQRESR